VVCCSQDCGLRGELHAHVRGAESRIHLIGTERQTSAKLASVKRYVDEFFHLNREAIRESCARKPEQVTSETATPCRAVMAE
jgi:hypothetical protein